MSRRKALVQRALPVVVSAAVLVWLLQSVDLAGVVEALSPRVALVMVPAFLFYAVVSLLIEALSITRIVDPTRYPVGVWIAARIKCATYLVGILHYALGAGALAMLMRRRTGLPLGEAASLVVLIASADLIIVLSATGVGAALLETSAPTVRAGVLGFALVGFFGGLAILRTPRSLGPLDRLRTLSVFEGLRTITWTRLVELLWLRAAFCASFVTLCALAFQAFQLPVPLAQLVVGVLVVAVVAALPIAVAGLGTSQAAFVYVFSDVAGPEQLLALSLVVSAGILSLRAGMGLVFAREFTREALRETRSAET